jgi:hypothetical protein
VPDARLLAHARTLTHWSELVIEAIHRRISQKIQARAGISGQTALASKRVAFSKCSIFA